MTHEDFIAEVAKRLEWPEEKTAGIIGTILEVVSAELKMNNPVIIDDFGTLKTDIQAEYILVDPETRERYLMPPAMEVVFESLFQENEENPLFQTSFIPDEVLYDEVNSSFSQFEPTPINEGVQFPGIPEIIAEEEDEPTPQPEFSSHVKPEEDTQPLIPDEEVKEEIITSEQTEVDQAPKPIVVQSSEPVIVQHSPPRNRSRRKLRSNKRTSSVWIPIAGGIAIVMASLFFSRETGTGKMEAVVDENSIIRENDPVLFAEPVVTPSIEEPVAFSGVESTAPPKVEPVSTLPNKEVEKLILPAGKTLRLLALDLFGSREFWVYIYLENREKIHNPNRVPSGTELVLPDRLTYSIDAADPQSVAKAKSLGDKVLEGF